jgi:hypothetical protein
MRWGKVEKPVIITTITGFRVKRGKYQQPVVSNPARLHSMTVYIDSVR